MKKAITVQGVEITLIDQSGGEYFCLTDMTKNFGGSVLIEQWLRNQNTIEFFGVWESLNNPDFNFPEFEGIKNKAGLNRFSISVKHWTEATNAIGLKAQAGRYGGTYAHRDIAFEFGSWLSPEFKLYLIREFHRLKEDEAKRIEQGWDFKRMLTKVNYRIHTNSIQEHLIPPALTKNQHGLIYASEADLLNKAVFGQTAKEWQDSNPSLRKKGNIRDYAEVEQLVVLSNLESINAVLISHGLSKQERLLQLNKIAISQLQALTKIQSTKIIKTNPKIWEKIDKAISKAAPPVQEAMETDD